MTKAATLFSGAGLSTQALKNVGCEIVFGVEADPQIAEAYEANHGDNVFIDSVEKVAELIDSVEKVAELIDFARVMGADNPSDILGIPAGDLDILQASPSCKKFAKVNWANQPDESDDVAIDGMVKIILTLQPKTIVIENVVEFLNSSAEAWLNIILAEHYHLAHQILNAADFGAPQARKRLFITGIRKDLPGTPYIIDPGMKHQCWYEAIADLEASHEIYYKFQGDWRRNGTIANDELPARLDNIIAKLPPRDRPVAIEIVAGKDGVYHSGKPFHTIRAIGRKNSGHWHRHLILYPDNTVAKMTPRMLARLMGLSDDFILPQRDCLAGEVLGNGVCVQVMEAIATQLLAQVRDIRSYLGTETQVEVRRS